MNFVTLTKLDRHLRITLTPEGRTELQARLDDGDNLSTDSTLYDLLENHLCNGWEWIRPEEIGALTSAPILTDDCSRDDNGLLTAVGPVYWFEKYQIQSPGEQLLRVGHVDFDKAE